MDIVYHVLIAVRHVMQPTEQQPTNVQAVIQASELILMDNVNHVIHHARPAALLGKQIHAHHVLKTLQRQLQDIVYVTSLRFVLNLVGLVRTIAQVVPFLTLALEPVKTSLRGKILTP
jgi:hypothetical protein